ncbi:undecaprenyl diphosphate phosphatase [Syntrophotalea carbinolica DSM 2380]|uniref:Undecaprenyl-diphosphatase n=1 Tax=Syntrophotalea carbinolica (strain DSM 2380 / NBRC 103641 / GraBd1) TaxID=338963 RepID=UPPP_SYNC1|nr:undecaprenyl-diphosphate phosphatase [Syntrophotalea carbinolica]Q3A6V2.1 RecName: Full=Undecaprenyl-diphosphatase; AltName: Full=Bacitracin resistance protein; AltName: Full=Undecaprenyl pyrophosphate phosphatase [Syntrophotalea carbinolica DSM 2380]ABA87905.1 undecaprenyl diphosphate phosphatase [Syntrophotalea carbinolica DSM 2380]
MSFLHAILLGLLQGLTEFLPVSSSGHLAIAQHFLPGFSQPGVLFDVLLHAGTMAAVLVYFRYDCRHLALAYFRPHEEAHQYRRLLRLLIIATVPTAIIGLSFKDFFVGAFHNLPLISLMLVVTGGLLFFSERLRKNGRSQGHLQHWDALIAGVAQAGAIMPGISRSGSTISVLLFKGVSGETAARFSFLMALPAVFGATLVSLLEWPAGVSAEIPVYAAGAVMAFLSGLASIHLLMGVVRRRRLYAFAVYCWLMGGMFFAISS